MKALIFICNCLVSIFCIVAFMLCIVAPECLLVLVILAAISPKKNKNKVYIMYDDQGRRFKVTA